MGLLRRRPGRAHVERQAEDEDGLRIRFSAVVADKEDEKRHRGRRTFLEINVSFVVFFVNWFAGYMFILHEV